MAARKLQQEVEKCFKKVDEGCQEFDQIYEKIEQSTSLAQKDKQEENLKREIKKLQRMRDQIKTWHANGDVKDKEPLMEKRRQIETKMELFKAVEKAMKTKAFSKEGLSAAAKLDPKERARAEACEFLSEMVETLDRQLETLESEQESLQATIKKGKKAAKEDRIAEIERISERHKWHQEKLELIRRSLENGGLETEEVNDLEETIRYYVSDGMNEDFMEDEEMYDDLNLVEEEDLYAIPENDGKSNDAQSVSEETPDPESRSASIPNATNKPKPTEPPAASARRPSQQLKSPLPVLATLNTAPSNGTAPPTPVTSTSTMKPAPIPAPLASQPMKYASIASAAAANSAIAPLPPAAGATPPTISAAPATTSTTASASPVQSATLPAPVPAKPLQPPGISEIQTTATRKQSPAPSHVSATASASHTSSVPPTPVSAKAESVKPAAAPAQPSPPSQPQTQPTPSRIERPTAPTPNAMAAESEEEEEEASLFHLPPGFEDLVESMHITYRTPADHPTQIDFRRLNQSWNSRPTAMDADVPYAAQPKYKCRTPEYYPQIKLNVFDDPASFSKIDPDTLFYIFYYQQGTYQQYLAAKSLKDQSWRYHTKYKTWFQRHEEPKSITDEFEQGTYRFFDYESTWMNRRKQDFQFRYKFLEEDTP